MSFLANNFDLLTQRPDQIEQLKQLILQLAVRGKLVPQDPADEPASVLLQKIQAEKARLVKEGQLKKSKPLLPVGEEELELKLPVTWEYTRLGYVGQIVGGGTPKTTNKEYFSVNGIPWITPADLGRQKVKYIEKGRRNISKLGLEKSSAQLLPKGTILFSSRAPIGHIAIAANPLATNQGFKSCVPFLMGMNEYIYIYLKSIPITKWFGLNE